MLVHIREALFFSSENCGNQKKKDKVLLKNYFFVVVKFLIKMKVKKWYQKRRSIKQ